MLRKCQSVRWSADIGVGSLAHRAGSDIACETVCHIEQRGRAEYSTATPRVPGARDSQRQRRGRHCRKTERRFAAGAAHTWMRLHRHIEQRRHVARDACLAGLQRSTVPPDQQSPRTTSRLTVCLGHRAGQCARPAGHAQKLEEAAHLYWPRVRGFGAGSDADTGSAVKPSAPDNGRSTTIASAPGITALEPALVSESDGVPTRPHTSEDKHCMCFASVARCAVAQILVSAGFASPGLKTALIVAPVTHPRCGHRLRRPSGLHKAPI